MKNISSLTKNKFSALKKAQNDVAREVFEKFSAGYPADRTISASLRARKFLGSRDRRFISENIFALFRWWGWIKICINTDCEIRRLAANQDTLEKALNVASKIGLFLEKNDIHNLATDLSREYSIQLSALAYEKLFPDFFALKLSERIKFKDICLLFQTRPPIWLRTKHGQRERIVEILKKHNAVTSSPVKFLNSIKVIKSDTSLYALPEFKDGLFEIQDIASQIIGITTGAKSGEKWLDACAGAGGKTLQIAEMMGGKGSIISQDIDDRKITELKRRTARASLSNVRTRIADSAKKDKRREQFFDGILVDAPCSCSGTWRRNPDGRWRTQESELNRFHEKQVALLNALAPSLRIGGRLIYATCSVFKHENEDVSSDFLATNKNFQLDEFVNPIDETPRNSLLYVPAAAMDSDATFVARFKKI
jgi:16S rRNA (cytosine967-C5)-methyltransferase